MSNVAHMHEMIDGLAALAEDDDPFLASVARGGLEIVEESLRTTGKTISKFRSDSGSVDDLDVVVASLVTPESLAEMAAIASEFDKSGDPLLMKQAAVLDEILLTIGAHKGAVAAMRRAQDEEIARIKAEAAESKEGKDPYTLAKKVHDKSNNVAEAQAAIQKIKDYRPMEAPLNTRTCPDHPGAQMARVAESTWQCSLDKGIYNYENGYTTMKGNKIPGGDVSNQTQALYDRPNEFTSFETRESKLNPN